MTHPLTPDQQAHATRIRAVLDGGGHLIDAARETGRNVSYPQRERLRIAVADAHPNRRSHQ